MGVDGFQGVTDADGLILCGIGGNSREVFDAYRKAGKQIIFFDKGYTRSGYLRVSVNADQPIAYFQKIPRPSDRFDALGIELHPYRQDGTHVLFDGASNKYCLWKGLGNHVEWGQKIVDMLRQNSRYPIIYRPRPSHNTPVAVVGAELSLGPLSVDLARTRVVVSHGGNIGWDSVIAGVPHFALGDSIAGPLSDYFLNNINKPRVPSETERRQWCADVAYCQFTMEEIESGKAWRVIKNDVQVSAAGA